MGSKGQRSAKEILHQRETEDIGALLAEARQMLHLTQKDLGTLVGIPRKRLGYIERGERPVYLWEALVLVRFFHDESDGLAALIVRMPAHLRVFITDELHERFLDA